MVLARPATGVPVTPAQTCEVLRWTVFGPGWYKGTLYSPEMVRRIAANFQTLSGEGQVFRVKARYIPRGKMGHDAEQRLTRSAGLPNTGRITAARITPDGNLEIDVTGVPLWLGAMINAGQIDDGSIELSNGIPDPADPSQEIPGPILTAVAFLGEEQPAVKGYPPPRATFPPGATVPPPTAPEWYLDLTSGPGDGAGEPDYLSAHAARLSRRTVRFSEMSPVMMNRDQIIAALAAKGIDVNSDPKLQAASDADLKELLDNVTTSGFSAAAKCYAAKFGEQAGKVPDSGKSTEKKDDQAPGWFSDFVKKYSDDREADQKRLGSLEKFAETSQNVATANQDHQMSERVGGIVDRAILGGHVLRRDRTRFIKDGVEVLKTKTFSTVANDGEKALGLWETDLFTRPTIARQDPIPDTPEKKTGPQSESQRAMVRPGGVLAQHYPKLAERLRTAS